MWDICALCGGEGEMCGVRCSMCDGNGHVCSEHDAPACSDCPTLDKVRCVSIANEE